MSGITTGDKAANVELTLTGLVIKDGVTFDEMVERAQQIDVCHRAVKWWIGDWLNYAEEKPQWGDKYEQATTLFGLAAGTLMNYKSVAKRVPQPVRTELLDWSFHKVVAKLPAKDQKKWLKKAAPQLASDPPKMSTHELRKAIKDAGGDTEPDTDALGQDREYEVDTGYQQVKTGLNGLIGTHGNSGPTMTADSLEFSFGQWQSWKKSQQK